MIATARSPEKADDLKAIAAEHDNLVIEELDVTDDAEIAALDAKYDGQAIDIIYQQCRYFRRPHQAIVRIVGFRYLRTSDAR